MQSIIGKALVFEKLSGAIRVLYEIHTNELWCLCVYACLAKNIDEHRAQSVWCVNTEHNTYIYKAHNECETAPTMWERKTN